MGELITVERCPSVFSNIAVAVLSLGLVIGILNKLIV